MSKKWFFAVIVVAIVIFVGARNASAQSTNDGGRFELGGQFSTLRLSSAKVISVVQFPCFAAGLPLQIPAPPCPIGVTIRRAREIELGLGGRVCYSGRHYIKTQ